MHFKFNATQNYLWEWAIALHGRSFKAEHECTHGWPRYIPMGISISKCHTCGYWQSLQKPIDHLITHTFPNGTFCHNFHDSDCLPLILQIPWALQLITCHCNSTCHCNTFKRSVSDWILLILLQFSFAKHPHASCQHIPHQKIICKLCCCPTIESALKSINPDLGFRPKPAIVTPKNWFYKGYFYTLALGILHMYSLHSLKGFHLLKIELSGCAHWLLWISHLGVTSAHV